jgi:hypothetical protein
MTKNDINGWLSGFGCFGLILIILACVLLVFPLLIALGGLIWGCVIYAVWNWVVVPVAAAPALTFFWQCFILGVALSLLLGAIKGVASASKS